MKQTIILALLFATTIDCVGQTKRGKIDAKPPPVASQTQNDSPSLQETLKWLKDTLTQVGNFDRVEDSISELSVTRMFYTFDSGAFDTCTLDWKSTLRSHRQEFKGARPEITHTSEAEFIVPLATIDLSSVKAVQSQRGKYWQVDLSTTKLERSIKHKYKSRTEHKYKEVTPDVYEEPKENTLHVVSIYVSEEEVARRVSKALVHAVKLCGGKTSPF